MIKQQLTKDLQKALESLGFQSTDIVVYIPQNANFGDYATNVALQLTKQKSEKPQQTPLEIANNISEKMLSLVSAKEYLSEIKIAGPGFINFFIKEENLRQEVLDILQQGDNYGQRDLGQGKSVQVEFVSANPTGPLTLANGRGGALGDTLASVFTALGYQVSREYYLNDTGNQVRLLGESVLAAVGKIPEAESHYKGLYIKELAETFKDQLDLEPLELGHKLAEYLLEQEIKPAINRFGIQFDNFYSERSIYGRGLIEKTLQLFEEKSMSYQAEGAVWLKTEQFGDEKDRVIMTSEEKRGRQEPTYLLPDLAYHIDVLSLGLEKKINIWGADHHGYVQRFLAGVAAAGFQGKVDIILMQMVKLFQGGQEVRMSKRAGTFVTLDELLEQVGKDAARFFFLMYSPNSPIDFNLDIAKEQSNKNPVYYVQYAHARMVNIRKKAEEKQDLPDVNLLTKKEEMALIKHLSQFPSILEEISSTYQVHQLTSYALQLADLFHKFYEVSPVLQAESEELKQSRLSLVRASQIILKNTLHLMGIEAPEKM